MHKIAVITGTRAEYGILKNIIRKIDEDEQLELQLIVTGTHLSEEYGYTAREIEEDGFAITEKIQMIMQSNTGASIVKSMGLLMINLSQTMDRIKPDILVILGDRYEILAAAATAMEMNIPIAHLCGGEVTEGAIDEQIRHSITKMAHLHFTASEQYAQNVIKMGEERWRVYNVGHPSIENIKIMEFMTKREISIDIGVDIDHETLLVTFHPTTLELKDLDWQIDNLTKALKELNLKTVITYPNADEGGKLIIGKLQKLKSESNKVYLFDNLGVKKYLSIMRLCGAVVGNSSSALVEAPYLKVPVVNIGNRQKGRLKASNILNSSYCEPDIIDKVKIALSDEFRTDCGNTISLYGEGNTSTKIVQILKTIDNNEKLMKKKLIWDFDDKAR